MRDLGGTTLGHYRIVELIGAGGMGVVYRARDARLDRDVAIKVLPDAVAADPDRVARFEREAKAVAKLEHPNILAIHEFGADDDVHFAVTELLEGQSLRHLLVAAGGPLPWRRVREIGAAVAEGLGAAHGRGVIHRDLKPENIFVTTDGRVKILDFGLAQVNEPVDAEGETATLTPAGTVPGTVLGTVGYMAPEQVRGKPADERSDLFALGCVLYEMLTGQRAFSRGTTAEIMTAILREEPPSLVASGFDVAPEVERVVDRCLEKSPERRFQSARDLAFALESLTGRSAPAGPVADELPTHPRRRTVFAVAFAGLSLLLGVLLGAVLWSRPTGVDLGSYRFTPFATEPDNEFAPAWSPDGRSIAYTSVDNGQWQIFTRSLDVNSAVQITDLADGAGWPFWSPDGRRVWFLSDGGVWSVGRAGGEPELVHEGRFNAGALSPDGTTFAAWRWTRDENASGSVWLASPPRGELRRYEPAPFEVAAALSRNYLRFSPDSTSLLASIQGDEGVELWLLPVPPGDGVHERPRRVFSDMSWQNTPQISWMPDGRRVVMSFAGSEEGRRQLWMADVRTDRLQPLTVGIREKCDPDVAPDGSTIVFGTSDVNYDLVEVPLDGSSPRGLYTTSQQEFAAAWVPGQDRFVYTAERGGQVQIRIRSRNGEWDRAIVTEEDFPDEATRIIQAPIVSPDGTTVAYARWPDGGSPSIWLSPIAGGAPTKVAEAAGSQVAPDWSPDGRWLSFVWWDGGERRLSKSRVGATDPPQTLVEGCVNGVPAWSPTGEWIAYATCSTGPDQYIRLVSPDGIDSRVLISMDPQGIAWSRDGRMIYAVRDDQLVSVEVRSGEETVIREFGRDMVVGAAWGPNRPFSLASDGKSLSVSVFRVHRDLWLLEGFDRHARWFDRFR